MQYKQHTDSARVTHGGGQMQVLAMCNAPRLESLLDSDDDVAARIRVHDVAELAHVERKARALEGRLHLPARK